MTPPLIDIRYPFVSFGDFVSRGYFCERAAVHLVVAWLGMILLSVGVFFLRPKLRAFESFAILSMVLVPFSNPAFQIMGLFPADIFGMLCFVLYFSGLFSRRGIRKGLPLEWMCFWALIAIHSLFVFLFYNLGDQQELLQRIVLVARPIISLVVTVVVGQMILARSPNREKLFLACFGALLIAAIVYLLQILNFSDGIIPYGTMPSAGFGGVRFGGVSNEGGHLAKLSYPVIMILLLLVDSRLKWVCFAAFSAIFLLNVSATGYVVYALFFCTASCLYLLRLLKKLSLRTLAVIVPLLITVTVFFLPLSGRINTLPIYSGLMGKMDDAVNKIWSPELDVYGRSPLIAKAIVEKYPMGIGYGGSTQRNIVMSNFRFVAKENNLGINVAIASWSFFSLTIFLFLSIKFILGWFGTSVLQKSAFLSLIGLMTIDVIWSNPAVYCALMLAVDGRIRRKIRDNFS